MGNYFFKPRPITVDGSLLKHTIANKVNDALLYQTTVCVDTEAFECFERALGNVRDEAGLEYWENLAYTCVMSESSDFEKTLREIIKEMSSFNSGRLFTMYAFVVDVIAFKLKNRINVDVDQMLNVLSEELDVFLL